MKLLIFGHSKIKLLNFSRSFAFVVVIFYVFLPSATANSEISIPAYAYDIATGAKNAKLPIISKSACKKMLSELNPQFAFGGHPQRAAMSNCQSSFTMISRNLPQVLTRNEYLQRRLAAYYSFRARTSSSITAAKLCTEIVKQQQLEIALEEEWRKLSGGRRLLLFSTDEDWELAERYGLSEGELSTIRSYAGDLSHHINQGLRKGGEDLEKVRTSTKVLRQALEKLPPYDGKDPLFRIEDSRWMPETARMERESSSQMTFSAFTSTSAGGNPKKNGNFRYAIFAGPGGRDISKISKIESEKEVILLPGKRFKVLARRPNRVQGENIVMDGYDFVLVEIDKNGRLIANVPPELLNDPESLFDKLPSMFWKLK